MDYETFFGLNTTPFRLSPDPQFFYPSHVHDLAIQTLQAAIQDRAGHILLTGATGSGKTITIRAILHQVRGQAVLIPIFNPHLSPDEIMALIFSALPGAVASGKKQSKNKLPLIKGLVEARAQAGEKTVLLIDDAHLLTDKGWELLVKLSEFNGPEGPHIQMIMSGKPDLEKALSAKGREALDNLATVRFQLTGLSPEESEAYVHHRLKTAGANGETIFEPDALKEIHTLTRGVPRLINVLCERALMAAFADNRQEVAPPHLTRAVASLPGEEAADFCTEPPKVPAKESMGRSRLLALFGVLTLVAGVYFYISRPEPPPQKPVETKPAPPRAGVIRGFVQKPPEPPKPPTGEMLSQASPLVPTLPRAALTLPPKGQVMAVILEEEKAYLWEGQKTGMPLLKAELAWPDPPPEGLYIMGQYGAKRQVFFSYTLDKQGRILDLPGLWNEAADLVTGDVVPVVVRSKNRPVSPEDADRAAEIRALVRQWVDAWKNKDLEKYVGLYGEIFTSYDDIVQDPKIYMRNEFTQVKKKVFGRSGDIRLDVTPPVCVLDPHDTRLAIAVFKQTYISDVFRRQRHSGVVFPPHRNGFRPTLLAHRRQTLGAPIHGKTTFFRLNYAVASYEVSTCRSRSKGEASFEEISPHWGIKRRF
jgi:general secretion pathway protein A